MTETVECESASGSERVRTRATAKERERVELAALYNWDNTVNWGNNIHLKHV